MASQELIPGSLTQEEARRLRGSIRAMAAREFERGKRFLIGTLVGSVRTKQFPENAIDGQPVRVIFVADVRLKNYPGMPLARDVLVTNQAHQLITGRQTDGMPVTLTIGAAGSLMITGRAALQTAEQAVDYHSLDALDGQEMEYVLGLRIRNTADLAPTLLAALNVWRMEEGLDVFASGEDYFYDPQGDVHGEDYYRAYIKYDQGGRFPGSTLGLVCETVKTPYSWSNDDFWNIPDGFTTYGWAAETEEYVCT